MLAVKVGNLGTYVMQRVYGWYFEISAAEVKAR